VAGTGHIDSHGDVAPFVTAVTYRHDTASTCDFSAVTVGCGTGPEGLNGAG